MPNNPLATLPAAHDRSVETRRRGAEIEAAACKLPLLVERQPRAKMHRARGNFFDDRMAH